MGAFAVIIVIALFQVISKQSAAKEFSYTDISRQIDAGNIATAEITEGKSLKGEFKAPVPLDGHPVKQFTVLLPVANSQEFLDRLDKAGVTVIARQEKGSLAVLLITVLPWVVMIGLWWFLLRQLQAGGNHVHSRSASRRRSCSRATPRKITFADVAGADEAKVELEEVIEFLKDPCRSSRVLAADSPKDVRCWLARRERREDAVWAKAVAGEAGRPFFSMSGSDFRGDVRRQNRWRVTRARPLRTGEGTQRPASSSSTKSMPLAGTAVPDSAAGMTSASRRSTNSWSRWMDSNRTTASS